MTNMTRFSYKESVEARKVIDKKEALDKINSSLTYNRTDLFEALLLFFVTDIFSSLRTPKERRRSNTCAKSLEERSKAVPRKIEEEHIIAPATNISADTLRNTGVSKKANI